MPAANAKSFAVETGVCPVDISVVKDDLGITATTDDAWLQRRMDGTWARMERYCSRPLQPATVYQDDWGLIAQNLNPWWRQPATLPPSQLYLPMVARPIGYASVFLRAFPVSAIQRATLNGSDYDPTLILFDGENGKLIGVQGPGTATDLSNYLLSSRAQLQYVAGFAALPADLYEALLGVMQVQWSTRQMAQSGVAVAGFLPTAINAMDVGSVTLSLAPNYLADQASRAGKVDDPVLGIYAKLLDPFIDWRTMIGGSAYPVTTTIGPPAREPAAAAE
jgi:hypothetical protein